MVLLISRSWGVSGSTDGRDVCRGVEIVPSEWKKTTSLDFYMM